MKIFVMSLARSSERRRTIIEHLTAEKQDFEIIDCVDGSKLSEQEVEQYCDMEMIRSKPDHFNRGLIGSSLTHYFFYQRMIRENMPHACIIEDDIRVIPDFEKLLAGLEEKMGSRELVLLYYTAWNRIELKPAAHLMGKYELMDLANRPGINSSAGYVVSLSAARKIVDFFMPVRSSPDNWELYLKANVLDMVSCVHPQPLYNTHVKSSIEYLGKESALSRFFSLVDRYRIFPIYQVLKWRRKMGAEKMQAIKILR